MHHRSPGDPAFEYAFNTLLLIVLGWEHKKDSGNEFFLSILGSSGEDEYRPLYGNQTPKGNGQPGNSPDAPVPVYGMLLRAKTK